MARKSRKTDKYSVLAATKEQKAPEVVNVPVAAYCRLSKADEITGRESMNSQISIIRQYVENADSLILADVFTDDGFTGTNYDRPQFELMMEGIRSGKYKCLIVKDLSRLGRSYIETSDLLELELPMYGCRFISVNDRIDTDTSPIDTILVGLKNLMNQKFAEDISRKIKAGFKERASKGEFLGGPVPFGYERDPENPGFLIINEEKAAIVRYAFALKIQGLTDVTIARKLGEEGYHTPKEYMYFAKHGAFPEKKAAWNPDTVRTMTMNQAYLGHTIHNQFKEKPYLGARQLKNRQEDFVIYENVNPAIISKDTFDVAIRARNQLYRGEIQRWKTR